MTPFRLRRRLLAEILQPAGQDGAFQKLERRVGQETGAMRPGRFGSGGVLQEWRNRERCLERFPEKEVVVISYSAFAGASRNRGC